MEESDKDNYSKCTVCGFTMNNEYKLLDGDFDILKKAFQEILVKEVRASRRASEVEYISLYKLIEKIKKDIQNQRFY